MRRVRLALMLLSLLFGLSLTFPAAAQSKTLVWERYDVFLTVQADGTMQVVERQSINFTSGTFTFGFAIIPLRNTEGIRNLAISEPGGRTYLERSFTNDPYEFYTTRSGDEIEVRWYFPPVANETRTYDLSYTVDGAVRIYETGDKLQWLAISGERDFPIENATVTVTLPEGASIITNPDSAGVRVDWVQNNNGRTVTYTATRPMAGSEFIDIGVEFTHGVVPAVKPSWQERVDQEQFYTLNVRPWLNLLIGVVAILGAVGGPILAYLLWYMRGRDPEIGPVPEYVSEPPEELPAGLLGSLIDEQADMNDVVATIIDLARKGYLAIEETQERGFFGLSSTDHIFRRLKSVDEALAPYERQVMRGLFGKSRDSRKLSDLRNKFYKQLPKIQETLYESLEREGYFKRRPDKVRNAYRGIGVGVIVLAFLSLFVAAPLAVYAGAFFCLPVALGIAGLSVLIAGGAMPVKTLKGSEASARWLAFKKYLLEIERHQDLKEAAQLFDRYLPYAIAFGMKNSWVNKFSRLTEAPAPGWYIPHPMSRPIASGGSGGGRLAKAAPAGSTGPGGLQGMSDSLSGGLQSMSDGLTSLLNSTGRVLGSAPSSSGSSGGGGFSGGGFSGGGGGGGGARGFG